MGFHFFPSESSELFKGITYAATVENIMEFTQKVKSRNTVLSSKSTTAYLLEENENTNSNICMFVYVNVNSF